MKRRLILPVVISFVSILIVVVGIPVYTTSHYNSEIKRNSKILDFMIRDFKYKATDPETSNVGGSILFYVLGIRMNKIDFKEYTILDGAEVEISTFNQEQFIISLHSNTTVACKWQTDYSRNYFEIKDQYFFQPNEKQTKLNQVVGGSEWRVNFRFKALKKSLSTMSFKQVFFIKGKVTR